jgi:short-subunit dehydrogenase
VTDSDTVAQAVTAIEAEHGPLEAVVLNAGDYEPMAAAEFDADLFRRLMEVNYFGVVYALDALLPVMTARARGQILINASLSAYRGLPRAAPYGASKAALLNLAEALHSELQGSGVRVRVINPGFVKTALTDKNRFTMPFLVSPEAAARAIAAGLERSRFEITFPLRFALLMKLLRCLPYGLYFRVTGRLMS